MRLLIVQSSGDYQDAVQRFCQVIDRAAAIAQQSKATLFRCMSASPSELLPNSVKWERLTRWLFDLNRQPWLFAHRRPQTTLDRAAQSARWQLLFEPLT